MKSFLRFAFIALLLCGGAATSPAAGPFEAGAEAYSAKDYVAAAKLFRQSADNGESGGQFFLGVIYRDGLGVPQDFKAAAGWFRKAADQGHEGAEFYLGAMHQAGQGVPQDFKAAAGWFRKAADRGNATAQYNLGVMYGKGEGVPEDFVLAHYWFNLAAARFTGSNDERRKQAVYMRDNISKLMTSAQIAEAQRLAREWRPK